MSQRIMTVRAPSSPLLTADATAFVADLVRTFRPRVKELLAKLDGKTSA